MSKPHEILGVAEDAPEAVIDAAYRALSKKKHPDQGGTQNEFKEIKKAYEQIKSSEYTATQSPPDWSDSIFQSAPAKTFTGFETPSGQPTIEGDILTIQLKGIMPNEDASKITHSNLNQLGDDPERNLVLFDIQNNTEDVQQVHRDEMTFVGDDGFTYQAESATIDGEKLGPRWTHFNVELESESRTFFIVMVEKMPKNSQLSQITYSHYSHAEGRVTGWAEGKERYEFKLHQYLRNQFELPGE